jgi:hypothetical protein
VIHGPGGSGKTNIIRFIAGRAERVWKADSKIAKDNPDDFYVRGMDKEGKLKYGLKAQKIVLTPIGRAAQTVSKRHGVLAKTVAYFENWNQHNRSDRFHGLHIVIVDETGLL